MTHNKKNKTIYYNNAVIKVYDLPIFYLPKFLDKTFSLLFGKSPSRRIWFLSWVLMGLLYFLTIFKLYIEIDSVIKYKTQYKEYV